MSDNTKQLAAILDNTRQLFDGYEAAFDALTRERDNLRELLDVRTKEAKRWREAWEAERERIAGMQSTSDRQAIKDALGKE